MRFRIFWIVIGGVVACAACATPLGESSTWPTIEALHKSFTFTNPDKDGLDTPINLIVRDISGKPAYKIECHNGDYDGDAEINFSGNLQCALFSTTDGKTATSPDLLAADTKDEKSADWWNRGRMLYTQLQPQCLLYPEYSNLRHFKLRSMVLTISFTDVQWNAGDISKNPPFAKFTVTFDAVSDHGVMSSRAELPPGPRPPTECYP